MRQFVTTSTWAALVTVLIITAGCGAAGHYGDARAADAKALRDLVDRTVAATARKDMGAYMKYYAPKATLVLPGMPITDITGPWEHGVAPGYAIEMVTIKAEVSDRRIWAMHSGATRRLRPTSTVHSSTRSANG